MRLEDRGLILAASRSSMVQPTSVRLPARRRYSKIANGPKTPRTATEMGLADWYRSGTSDLIVASDCSPACEIREASNQFCNGRCRHAVVAAGGHGRDLSPFVIRRYGNERGTFRLARCGVTLGL